MLMFLCPVHFFPCRLPMTSSDLLLLLLLLLLLYYRSKLENRIPKVDLPEIKGNHRKFRNLVTSYIGNSVYVCVHLSIFVRMYVCSVFPSFCSYDPVCLLHTHISSHERYVFHALFIDSTHCANLSCLSLPTVTTQILHDQRTKRAEISFGEGELEIRMIAEKCLRKRIQIDRYWISLLKNSDSRS